MNKDLVGKRDVANVLSRYHTSVPNDVVFFVRGSYWKGPGPSQDELCFTVIDDRLVLRHIFVVDDNSQDECWSIKRGNGRQCFRVHVIDLSPVLFFTGT